MNSRESDRGMVSADQKQLRVTLIGYGRMGRMVDQLAARHRIFIPRRLTGDDNPDGVALDPSALADTDVAIDFSTPDAVPSNVRRLCEAGVSAVIGTTGWEAHRDGLLSLARESGIGLVHGSNFSVGANAFFRVATKVAEVMMDCRELYDLALSETHHRGKVDSPSGTALRLSEAVLAGGWPRQADITSRRIGHVPGTHELTWDSVVDSITISHMARSRAGFAEGALLAARWIHGRSGVYDFSDCWTRVSGWTNPPVESFVPTTSGNREGKEE